MSDLDKWKDKKNLPPTLDTFSDELITLKKDGFILEDIKEYLWEVKGYSTSVSSLSRWFIRGDTKVSKKEKTNNIDIVKTKVDTTLMEEFLKL